MPELIDQPRIVTFADHQVITPPNLMRHAISSGDDSCEDPLARADKALAALSEKFPMWMQAEWARLAFAYAEVAAEGFNPGSTERLLRIAHDIRGNAPLYGFDEIAAMAASLCRLIEETASAQTLPRLLVGRHVDAIGAAARGRGLADTGELRTAVTQHLLRQSSVAICSPALAPA